MAEQVFFGSEYVETVSGLIRGARGEIAVAAYEWKWYVGGSHTRVQRVNYELAGVARRGVRVRALLHNESENRPLGRANRKLCVELVKRGMQAKMARQGGAMHAKVWIFDDDAAVVCSHNISRRVVTGARSDNIAHNISRRHTAGARPAGSRHSGSTTRNTWVAVDFLLIERPLFFGHWPIIRSTGPGHRLRVFLNIRKAVKHIVWYALHRGVAHRGKRLHLL